MAGDDSESAPSTSKGSNPIEEERSARLDDLISKATIQYSLKKYDEAAELYAHATELQAEINGEMSLQNADLLYAYGRCLYHVAVQKSDVLGSKVAGEKPLEKSAEKVKTKKDANLHNGTSSHVHTPALNDKTQQGPMPPTEDAGDTSKPFFQFTGDENFDTSDEDEGLEVDDSAENEDPDEEDDFANAFEVLDMARVLLMQRIEEEKVSDVGKGAEAPSSGIRQLEEKLADTYDLQAEISLEGERFQNAVDDLRSSLGWKIQLYPQESSILAEAHFKLSLALEFASVSYQKSDEAGSEDDKEAVVNYDMRADAAKEMEAAIASCRKRIDTETTLHTDTSKSDSKHLSQMYSQEIQNVQEMVTEMEQRVGFIVTFRRS